MAEIFNYSIVKSFNNNNMESFLTDEKIRNLILTDNVLQGKIMSVLNVSYGTIRRWAQKNDLRLTSTIVKKIINEHLKTLEPQNDKS